MSTFLILVLVNSQSFFSWLRTHITCVDTVWNCSCQGARQLVLGRSSKRNRISNILAAIDHNRDRDISKIKCDLHAFQVLYNLLSALSSHLTRAYCATKPAVNGACGQPRESARGRRPDGHNRVISVNGSAISPASVHALTLYSTQTVTRSRQRQTGFDRRSAGESTTFDAERDLHLTDCELLS